MDGEHRLQLQLLAAVDAAVADGRGAADIEALLDTLVDFSRVHFASEQTLMRLYAYPQYERHVADHDHTVEHLEVIRRHLRDGEDEAARKGLSGLADHLAAHIGSGDRAFADWLAEGEVKIA
jgi:hemerythrin